MNQLLAMPEVQSGAIPFVVALAVALLLRPLALTWSGLALAAGFYAAAYVIESGFDFANPTSTDKLLLAGLAAAGVGLIADLLPQRRVLLIGLLALLGGATGIWLVQPLLGREQGTALALLAAGAFAYPAWHAGWSGELRGDSLRSATAGWVLGLATAACVILGASARLGQLALALGVAAGAFWLLAVLIEQLRGGTLFALPAALLGALLGLAGATYARLPWQALALLALVPVLARVPLPGGWPRWVRAIVLALITVPAGVIAVVLVTQQGGGSDPYGGY
ncbi:MAG: hypothetical protein R3202_12980 [Candidatus Competibacterales bacterium]|nr:hypothetical protein [Candidatus Competibacterales bacterium]